jgi:hypothetical protein
MPSRTNQGMQVVTLGAVKSDGTPDIANSLFRFPVPHQQMSIRQGVKVDEVDVPGRSGKVKQAVGYEDTEISVSITLVDLEDRTGAVTKSALEQFQELQSAFRDRSEPVSDSGTQAKTATTGVPTIFSIQSRLTDACGIKTVLFKSLEASESPGETALEVSLTLVEFEPVARQIEKRALEQVAKAQATQEAKEAVGYSEAAHTAEVGEEDPLAAAFRQGKADAMGGLPG